MKLPHIRNGLISEGELLAAAAALGAPRIPNLSLAETELLIGLPNFPPQFVNELRRQIAKNRDPLGDAFAILRTAEERRENGATYTPPAIVRAMANWATEYSDAANGPDPQRIIDPGVGSARFLLALARKFPNSELIGVDVDPVATLIGRANLAAAGYEHRSRIILGDYRDLKLPHIDGRTLYIGNPPYVRHHLLATDWKQWLTAEARRLGYDAS